MVRKSEQERKIKFGDCLVIVSTAIHSYSLPRLPQAGRTVNPS